MKHHAPAVPELRIRTCPACLYQVPVAHEDRFTCPNCEEAVASCSARPLPPAERRRAYLEATGRQEA